MRTGIELIQIERSEQIHEHKRTILFDVLQNKYCQLVSGAIAIIRNESKGFDDEMPMNWDVDLCKKMANKSYKERLIIAGALIAAEIDRIQFINSK